jgi:HNH endonuclease
MKTIELTQGQVAIVDDEDFEELNKYNWCANRDKHTWYAHRRNIKGLKPRKLRMHSVIAGTPIGMQTDHINGNGLDNRRSNLRIVNDKQNNHNQTHKRKNTTSRFRGVSWYTKLGKWRAQLQSDGNMKHIGLFACEVEAARAYDAAGWARDPEHFTPNFPKI